MCHLFGDTATTPTEQVSITPIGSPNSISSDVYSILGHHFTPDRKKGTIIRSILPSLSDAVQSAWALASRFRRLSDPDNEDGTASDQVIMGG